MPSRVDCSMRIPVLPLWWAAPLRLWMRTRWPAESPLAAREVLSPSSLPSTLLSEAAASTSGAGGRFLSASALAAGGRFFLSFFGASARLDSSCDCSCAEDGAAHFGCDVGPPRALHRSDTGSTASPGLRAKRSSSSPTLP
eukprot:scaffold31385_cov62-Phaeocystis_antarctica.AAC.7